MNSSKKIGYILRNVVGTWYLLDFSDADCEIKDPIEINETGAFVWERLALGKSIEDIAKELAFKYNINYDDAYYDIECFVSYLQKFGVSI